MNSLLRDFPIVTFIIAIICLAVFLFTYKNLVYYENLLGYIPASPRLYSIITYTFMHASLSHLVGNIIMLILLGIVLENYLDSISYALIYFTSGVIAVIFDTLSRSLLGINAFAPFIGASGAIFGLAGVAMLVRPYENLPSIVVVLFIIPIAMLFLATPALLENPFLVLMALVFGGMLSAVVLFGIPSLPTIIVFFCYTIFTILFIVITGLTENVSYIGHLGGVFGGLLSFFLFCRKSEKEK